MAVNRTTSHPSHSPDWIVEDAAWYEDFKVKVWLRDGSIKIVDLSKMLEGEVGPVFQPLKELEFFAKAIYDEELERRFSRSS